MSIFQFFPSGDLATREQNFATCSDGFTEDQLAEIRRYGDASLEKAGVAGGVRETVANEELRQSTIAWIAGKPETWWIYDRISQIARASNGQYFEFDLWGIVDDIQYTVYDGGDSHYDWHIDKGSLVAPRKLSLVVQLSEPDEYQGGDLQLMFAEKPFTCERRKGMIYVFPSWILHRVTPVTAGIRRSLVAWIVGNKFR
jgi:PKHD-type hydroxylase